MHVMASRQRSEASSFLQVSGMGFRWWGSAVETTSQGHLKGLNLCLAFQPSRLISYFHFSHCGLVASSPGFFTSHVSLCCSVPLSLSLILPSLGLFLRCWRLSPHCLPSSACFNPRLRPTREGECVLFVTLAWVASLYASHICSPAVFLSLFSFSVD